MTDPAHKAADASLEAFSGEIAELYQQAYLDAVEALQKYLKGFDADDRLMRKKLASGELKQSDYREWRKRQMVLNKRYRAIVKQMAECASDANRQALDILDGKLPHIAAENANYAAYTIDKAIGMSTNFALQDADTVAVMLKGHGRYLPKPDLDIPNDERWNRQLLGSALTKGILLGESMPKISKRVSDVIGGSIHGQVMRVARTCVTAAENAGRIASYDRAESIGIELKKEWLATLDMRTRSSHRLLDGEQVANDEEFSNGCEYPGDPNCEDYGEIANCRCTMVAAVEGVDQSKAARWSRLPDGMTYDEWKVAARRKKRKISATQSKFVKSDTVYQAMDYAEKEFGIKLNTAYTTIGLDGANIVNEALFNIKEVTGITDVTALAYKAMKGGAVAVYTPGNRSVFLGSAFKGKNVMGKLEKQAKEQYDYGWWSSSDPMSSIYHEFGHHAHRVIEGNQYGTESQALKQLLSEFKKEIKQRTGSKTIRQRMTDEQALAAKDIGLSGYAMWNQHELVAESYAQIVAGNPSENAKRVIRALLGERDRDKSKFPKLWRAVE